MAQEIDLRGMEKGDMGEVRRVAQLITDTLKVQDIPVPIGVAAMVLILEMLKAEGMEIHVLNMKDHVGGVQ